MRAARRSAHPQPCSWGSPTAATEEIHARRKIPFPQMHTERSTRTFEIFTFSVTTRLFRDLSLPSFHSKSFKGISNSLFENNSLQHII